MPYTNTLENIVIFYFVVVFLWAIYSSKGDGGALEMGFKVLFFGVLGPCFLLWLYSLFN